MYTPATTSAVPPLNKALSFLRKQESPEGSVRRKTFTSPSLARTSATWQSPPLCAYGMGFPRSCLLGSDGVGGNDGFMRQPRTAFTLVELIVVITILAILGTIGFISLDKYTTQSRDAVRTEDLSNIRKGLEAYEAAHGKYPLPDNAVTIYNSGTVVRYQGYAGRQTLSNIKFSNNAGTDPLDSGTYYTYTTNALQTKMQLLAYLEDGTMLSLNTLNPIQAYADSSDYSKRFPLLAGYSLGILVQSGTLVPIQATGTGIDVATTSTGYVAYLANGNTVSGAASVLAPLFTATGVTSSGGTGVTMTASMVRDINPGASGGTPNYITTMNGILYFQATDSTNGTELWRSDGTTSGTFIVKDIYSGAGSSSPSYLTAI